MDRNRIEVGDIVSVTFSQSEEWFRKLEVLYTPCQAGDCWFMRNPDSGQIVYIQGFETMTLIQKGEKEE